MSSSAEYAMFGPAGQPISGISSNIVKDYTRHGCAVQAHPVRVGDEILFAQRDTLKVRAVSYKIQGDTNVAPDITLFSNDLTNAGGVIAATFAQNPDYMVWFVTSDGRMLSCAYDRDQNVIAWAQHNSTGLYEGICTVPGMSTDYTYVIMNRTINGATVRTVELMDYSVGDANTLGGPSLADCFFIETSGSPTNTITGLPAFMHGATGIMVVADGTVVPNCVVSNTGTINIGSTTGTYFVIGFPYTALIKTLVPEFGDSNNTTLVRQKSNSRLYFNVEATTDLVFNAGQKDEDGNLISPDEDIPFLTTSVGLGTQVAPYDGFQQVQSSGWEVDNQIYIKSPNPTECIILAIIYRTSLGND